MHKSNPGLRAIQIFLIAAVLLALAGCASSPKSGKMGADSYSRLMTQAETHVMAGRIDAALASFNLAAQADPTRKEPWLRSAQLSFDNGSYGRAIVASQEVLQRDPGDLVADSVLTVSGFRVATQSLQRLQTNGAITGDTARNEALALAGLMRKTMGESIVPAPQAARPAPRKRPSAAAPPRAKPAAAAATGKPEAAATTPASPFDKLGGN